MVNQLQTTNYILNDFMVRYNNALQFVPTANRSLEGAFGAATYATGDTINYRLYPRFLGGEGATSVAEPLIQQKRPLTIEKQYYVRLDFTGKELTFNRVRDEPMLRENNDAKSLTLANKVDRYLAQEVFQNKTYQAVGTPGVPVDFNTVLSAQAYLDNLGIPNSERYMAINPNTAQGISYDLHNSFNGVVNKEALMNGFVGRLAEFDIFKTTYLGYHVAGIGQVGGVAPAGFVLAGTVTNGPIINGNIISVAGLAGAAGSMVFRDGDIIEISEDAGVFMVNGLSYSSFGQRAQFVVVGDVVSANGLTANIPVSPTIVLDGALQNISAAIPNGAQLLLRKSHNVSLAYHKDALVFAGPPLRKLEGGVISTTAISKNFKIALTASLGADLVNYIQLDRVDTLAGGICNPESAIRVCS